MRDILIGGNEQIALRLCAALILGSALGLNRELHGKAAGLRTHALVCLGAAVATLVALAGPDRSLPADSNEIGRVVQGIMTGIGFLGADVILRDPTGHITGLTTAATNYLDLRRPRNCLRSRLLDYSGHCDRRYCPDPLDRSPHRTPGGALI